MYRVLFAEDELLVRLGLKNSIRWADYEMEVVGEADNGTTVQVSERFLNCYPYCYPPEWI